MSHELILDVQQVAALLTELSMTRPLFHSERDFQLAVGLAMHNRWPAVGVRMEVRLRPEVAKYTDIVALVGDDRIALELKHLTRAYEAAYGGERYVLRSQAAQDVSRYDVIKDITRIESLVADGVVASGFVVVLTNDQGYWNTSVRQTVDVAFRLHEGRRLAGELAWSDSAGRGTTRGRHAAHVLRGEYDLAWLPYSRLPGAGGEFRALIVAVDKSSIRSTGADPPTS
ncbi:MAG TPA: hypothetical protein VHB69_08715 [Mycobacteriales bacterium]|nr:hypothetical protein [Mycobacteriales bacterium]